MDVYGDLRGRDIEAVGDSVENPLIRLVEQEVIDFVDTDLIGFQALPNDLTEASYRLREHRPAFHARPDTVLVDLLLYQRRERTDTNISA